jgi:hypothetical protein
LDQHANEGDREPNDYRNGNDYQGVSSGHDFASGKRREPGAELE